MYVGQRGGQGAHTVLRCKRGTLGPSCSPGGGDDDDDWDDGCCCAVFGSILPLFYSCLLICFCISLSVLSYTSLLLLY